MENLVSIFRCSSPPHNPVYVRSVDPSVLGFSLSYRLIINKITSPFSKRVESHLRTKSSIQIRRHIRSEQSVKRHRFWTEDRKSRIVSSKNRTSRDPDSVLVKQTFKKFGNVRWDLIPTGFLVRSSLGDTYSSILQFESQVSEHRLPSTQPTSFKMPFTRRLMIVFSRFEFFVRV